MLPGANRLLARTLREFFPVWLQNAAFMIIANFDYVVEFFAGIVRQRNHPGRVLFRNSTTVHIGRIALRLLSAPGNMRQSKAPEDPRSARAGVRHQRSFVCPGLLLSCWCHRGCSIPRSHSHAPGAPLHPSATVCFIRLGPVACGRRLVSMAGSFQGTQSAPVSFQLLGCRIVEQHVSRIPLYELRLGRGDLLATRICGIFARLFVLV